MKKTLYIIFLLILPIASRAQLISNPNPPVPAAQGVGGAYTAAATGADAPFWNPAGLAYTEGTQGRFGYQQPWSLSFLTHVSATAATALPKKYGSIAVGFQSLGTRDGGNSLASESELFASHGFLLQEDLHSSLAFGYTFKLINYDLGNSVANGLGQRENFGSASTFGFDLGASAQLWDRFTLAGAFKNINHPQLGAGVKRDLPRMISGGVSYHPYYGVRTTFDIERAVGSETQFKGGMNAMLLKPLDLRFGIVTNPNSFTAGFGLHFREIVIDYAFIYHPVLDPSHLVGIGFNLDKSIAEIWQTK